MSDYDQLAAHLERRRMARWQASFEEIESIIGRKLPDSAYRHPAWWANQTGKGHSQTRGWRGAGWRTSKVNLAEQKVVFERDAQKQPSKAEEIQALVDRAKLLTDIESGDDIIVTALKKYLARVAGEQLVAMGGTMPDAWAAPRERPFA